MKNEEYKKEILNMLESMNNTKILKLIYGFTMSGYREEQCAIRISKMHRAASNN